MTERISTAYCPRCAQTTLHWSRGAVESCQACGYSTTGGRIVVGGEEANDTRRAKYRMDEVDEVAE